MRYAYTSNNRLSGVTDTDGNQWSCDYSNWVPSGLITESLPGGGIISRYYDAENRPVQTAYSDSTPSVSYDYASWITSGSVAMTDGVLGGSLVYAYDGLDHLTSVQRGASPGFSYDHFNDGSLKTRTFESSPEVIEVEVTIRVVLLAA